MKRYVPIIIGVVALCAVLYLGSNGTDSKTEVPGDEATSSEVTSKSFHGSFTKMFEGENTLHYGFDLPQTATATVSMDGALVSITETEIPVLAMYMSYEGARGFTPNDYITNNIMPKVTGVTIGETVKLGKYDWAVAESANSIWHIASVENGKWLLVAENKKTASENASLVLESVVTSVPDIISTENATEEGTETKPTEMVGTSEEETLDTTSTSGK